MAKSYIYLLIHPHRPGMLAVLGAFSYKWEAQHFAKTNYKQEEIDSIPIQLWRIKGRVHLNQMRCTEVKNWYV